MTTFRMENGTIVKTENAKQKWDEQTDWDGNNHISRPTKSQWEHQTLYQSRKNRFWILHESQWQGSLPHAEWVSEHEAARWLMLNEYELPKVLALLEDEISE